MSEETIINESEVPKKGRKLALQLLEQGKIELNKKGQPNIKDIMEKAGISRSYAFKARKEYLRLEKAREGALPSKVEVEEPKGEKPKPPPKREKPKIEEEEVVAEGEKPLTYEEVLEELKELEEMFTDIYDLGIGKESILTEITNDSDYGRSKATCQRLAKNWIRYLKRRVDPETLQGYDTIALAGNHVVVFAAILLVWWRKRAEKKKEKKKEGKT